MVEIDWREFMGDNMDYYEVDNEFGQNEVTQDGLIKDEITQDEVTQNEAIQDEATQDEAILDDLYEQSSPRMMSDKKILSLCGLYLSLMTIAIFAVQFLLIFIVGMVFPEAAEEGWFNIVLTAVGVAGVGLPVFHVLMKRIPDSEIGEQKKLSFGQFIGFFIICIAGTYISNMVGSFINVLIELIKGLEVLNPLETFFDSNMILAMVYAVICAPILEELIFRKILLDKLRRFGDLPAILLTGFAFGIFHFNLSQFFYATVLGVFFAYITIRTNRLRYAIILHMMVNSIGAGVAPLVSKGENMVGLGLITVWLFASMIVGSILFIINVKKIKLVKLATPLVRKRDYILNPGALLFLVIGIIVIALSLVGY